MAASGGVSGKMTGRLLRLLAQRERDVGRVLARCGVSAEEVSAPNARVPYALADELLEACVEESGIRAGGFALALAAVVDESTYDAAGLVLLTSPTFGVGLERALAYQRLWGDGERFGLRRLDDGGLAVRFRHPGPSLLAKAILTELAFLETMGAAKALVDPEASAESVRFEHEAIAGQSADERAALGSVYGTGPVWGARASEIVLGPGLVDGAVRAPEGVIARIHESLAKRALAVLPESASLAARVRAICSADPDVFVQRLEDVAKRLHMSARTFQRRLGHEGTSWATLLDELRRERVRELRLHGVSDKEIAFLVGFSDPSALTRARARWSNRAS